MSPWHTVSPTFSPITMRPLADQERGLRGHNGQAS
jgi:hypothetical protein